MFKKIKSIFIVEEPGSTVSSKAEDAAKIDNNNLKSNSTYTDVSISESVSKSTPPDVKFTDLLLKAIESNNMEGFDYLEFKNSLKSIEAVIPDESMRYKSAFEMAKTMGLTKEKLIQSAQHYISILANEDKKFKDALQNQRAKQIQGRADQIATIEKSIVEKQKLIESLNTEIETSKSQLDAVKNEINEAVVKLDTTNQQFVASYNLVFGQIDEDIQKINKNI